MPKRANTGYSAYLKCSLLAVSLAACDSDSEPASLSNGGAWREPAQPASQAGTGGSPELRTNAQGSAGGASPQPMAAMSPVATRGPTASASAPNLPTNAREPESISADDAGALQTSEARLATGRYRVLLDWITKTRTREYAA